MRDAQLAVERGDLRRADELFRDAYSKARDDASVMLEYGVFCLRTGRPAIARYLLHRADALQAGNGEARVHLGHAYLRLREFDAAKTHFLAGLSGDANNASAHYGLAICFRNENAWAEAVREFEQALSAQPDALPLILELAEARWRSGDRVGASECLANAERMAPDEPSRLLLQARFLFAQGSPARALALLDQCEGLAPGEPEITLERARCARALGKSGEALAWLRAIESRVADPSEVFEEIGNCLDTSNLAGSKEEYWFRAIQERIRRADFEPAARLVERWLADDPGNDKAWNALGILESARQRPHAAESAFRQAIRLNPEQLDAAANLGVLLESHNRVSDAQAVLEDAMPRAAKNAARSGAIDLHLTAAKLARRTSNPARGIAMLDAVSALDMSDAHRMHLSFERGRLLDKLGDAAQAFAAYSDGNALALAAWLRENPGRNRYLAGVEYMIALLENGWLRDWTPVGDLPRARDLSFLVGFPRSGTTLLNQALDCHSGIVSMEERPPVDDIKDAILAMPGGYPHAISQFDAIDVDYLRELYFRSAAIHGAGDANRLTLDKYPLHMTMAGMLHRVFPDARFIFAVRHPCDVVLSCFMQSFKLNNAMANFCSLSDTVALYVRTMDLWSLYREQLPLSVHTVRYEDVVDDFEGQTRSVCEFLGLGWESEMQQFSERALDRGHINTPSYEQVSQPIYRDSRYRWERYRAFLEPFLPALQPYIDRFGYSS